MKDMLSYTILSNTYTCPFSIKVTLIENLETYGIDPEELGHQVQIGVACSTSVSPLPGKGRGVQLMIQGNQVNYVAQLLLGKLLLL